MIAAGTAEDLCIDVHHHWMPPSLSAAVREAAAGDATFARRFASVLGELAAPLADVDDRLHAMDDAGVDRALLSAPPPAAEAVAGPGRGALATRVNEELLQLADRCPGRFLVALCLPLPDVAGACREIERFASDRRVRAVSVLTHERAPAIDAAANDALFGSCAEHRLAVLLHPGLDSLSPLLCDWNLASSIGAPLSTSLAAARLALSGTLDRHPALDVVIPHLGGLVPYLSQRLEDQSSPGAAAHPLSSYWRERFFYDTCSYHPPALRCARDSVGAERLLLGSDYPFRGNLARAVCDLDTVLSAEEALLARGRNAARWCA